MRVGIIGAGAVVRKAHLPALASMEGIEIASIADIDTIAARRAAKSFKIKSYCKDYKDLLKKDLDFVSICVPTPLHKEVAVEAARSGKHMLVEKPLALTIEEVNEIRAALKENNVKLSVIQNYRYFESIKEMKAKVDSGRLGRIISLLGVAHTKCPMSWTRSQWLYHSGGALYDFGPHLFDLICLFASSNPKSVNIYGGDYLADMNCINHANVGIQFENGAIADADVSWMIGKSSFSLNIYGTGGALSTEVMSNSYREIHGQDNPYNEFKTLSTKTVRMLKEALQGKLFKGALRFYPVIYREFIDSIEKNLEPPIGIDEATKVVSILDQARNQLREDIRIHRVG